MLHRWATIIAATLFALFLGQGSAWACTVPNFFVNNTVADADTVNANFTAVLGCLNVNLVVGPNSSVVDKIATWDNTSGSLLKDSGVGFPIPVGSGGTGDTGTAWASYNPGTITCQSGTMTSATTSGRFKTIGKTVFFIVSFTITTNGTCAGLVNLGVPAVIGGLAAVIASGNRPSNLASTLTCMGSAGFPTIGCLKYDGTYPFADGTSWIISGTYEGT